MSSLLLGPTDTVTSEPAPDLGHDQPLSVPGLPECHSRRAYNGETDVFFCAHPRMHSAGNLVSQRICRLCNYSQAPPPASFRPYPTRLHVVHAGPCLHVGEAVGLRDCPTCRGHVQLKVYKCLHPDHEITTIPDCARCIDYDQQLLQGQVRRWAVGITTAPRDPPTLERTLTSLHVTGWSEVRIFAEQESYIPESFAHLPVTWRKPSVGPWSNWWLGLAELYQRMPDADAYLMLQDDLVCCRDVRTYLEGELWPAPRVGVASFYCPSIYGGEAFGFQRINPRDGLIGALSYIFPPSAVRSLLTHVDSLAHGLHGIPAGTRSIDTVIGNWALARRFPVYYHVPSLGQHTGATSTIWEGAKGGGSRSASHFVGEDFSATTYSRAPLIT